MRLTFASAKRICIVRAVNLFNAYVISTRHESTNLIKIIASASCSSPFTTLEPLMRRYRYLSSFAFSRFFEIPGARVLSRARAIYVLGIFMIQKEISGEREVYNEFQRLISLETFATKRPFHPSRTAKRECHRGA